MKGEWNGHAHQKEGIFGGLNKKKRRMLNGHQRSTSWSSRNLIWVFSVLLPPLPSIVRSEFSVFRVGRLEKGQFGQLLGEGDEKAVEEGLKEANGANSECRT